MTAVRRGMTLLEVLIALGLTLALLAALFAFFHDVVRSRVYLLEHTAKQRAAATLIERIENDLIFSIVGDERFGPGIAGDNNSIRILTRGVTIQFAERGERDPDALADLQLAEYRFSRRSGIEARRGAARANIPNNPINQFQTLGGDLYRVQFRYHDGTDWRDSYDSIEQVRLPVALEVAIWFEPWPGAPEEDDDEFDDEDDRERLTFELRGTFDESAWASRAERDRFRGDPPPDRVRVITVPDAREEEGE